MVEQSKNVIRIDDEELEHLAGGNDAQFNEILEYIRSRDLDGYNEIMNFPCREVGVIRYLYDHGVPVIMMTDWNGMNMYTTGTFDRTTRKYTEGRKIDHNELMVLLRNTI